MAVPSISSDEVTSSFKAYSCAKGRAGLTRKVIRPPLPDCVGISPTKAKTPPFLRERISAFPHRPDAGVRTESLEHPRPNARHSCFLQLPGAGEPGRGKPDSWRQGFASSDRHARGPVCSGGREPLSCCEEAIMVWDWELCDARCVSRHWPAPRRSDRSRRERHRCRQCRHPRAEWQGLKGAPRARRAGSCAGLRD